MTQWDGMLAWCMEFAKKDNEIIKDKYIRRWYRAAIQDPQGQAGCSKSGQKGKASRGIKTHRGEEKENHHGPDKD